MKKAEDKQENRLTPRERLTNMVIQAIQEENTLPWRKPWQTPYQSEAAKNPITGTVYKGGNSLTLLVEAISNSYTTNRWVTRKQAENKKWEIKEDAIAVPIEVWDTIPFWRTELGKKELSVADGSFKLSDIQRINFKDETMVLKNKTEIPLLDVKFKVTLSESKSRSISTSDNSLNGKVLSYDKVRKHPRWNLPFARSYYVYNLGAIDGVPDTFMPEKKAIVEVNHNPEDHSPYVMAMLRGMEADKLTFNEDGFRAFYRPSTDSVTMPPLPLFARIEEYDTTLAHELGHATKAEHRLNRPSPDYAREELVAELTSLFIHNEFNVEMPGLESTISNHVGYLESWSKTLKDPKNVNVMYAAARDAGEAVDYLIKVAANAEPELMSEHLTAWRSSESNRVEKSQRKSKTPKAM